MLSKVLGVAMQIFRRSWLVEVLVFCVFSVREEVDITQSTAPNDSVQVANCKVHNFLMFLKSVLLKHSNT